VRLIDRLRFNAQLIRRHRMRALLLVFTIAVGVASVILLTSVGEGARRYVTREFSALGNRLLIVLPGRTETSGGAPPLYGSSPRDLTLDDAQALALLPTVARVAPIIAGTARVSRGAVSRDAVTLGMDLRDTVIIPVRSAAQLFDAPGLFRILVEVSGPQRLEESRRRILALIRQRHEGEEDVTLISQDALLATFDRILRMLTLTLAGIAAISLVVAGVLIMNISLISVSQRRGEIGLLKAIGASAAQVRQLFLDEALLLAALGAGAGVLLGELGVAAAVRLLPVFPFAAPLWADLAAVAVALLCGLLFAWWPASQAARQDPVRALRGLP
jgi:ABC-type antimicrobial peptide transport system permease subunit